MKKENKRNEVVEEVKTEETVKEKRFANKEKTVVPAEKVGAETVTTKGKTVIPKKAIFAACGVVAAVAVIVLVVLLVVNRDNSEEVMTGHLNDLGVAFYEEFYFKSAGSGDDEKRAEFLGRFSDIGIKVSLENLVRYYVTTEEYNKLEGALVDANVTERTKQLTELWFKNDKYECNESDTKVVIYPKASFGQKDYKLEVVTSCGFESEKVEEK